MKLVHWPLIGGLYTVVERGGDWGGPARPGHWLLRNAKKHLYAIYRLVRIQEFTKGEAVTAVDERPPQAEKFFSPPDYSM